jgi:hypothetical protein
MAKNIRDLIRINDILTDYRDRMIRITKKRPFKITFLGFCFEVKALQRYPKNSIKLKKAKYKKTMEAINLALRRLYLLISKFNSTSRLPDYIELEIRCFEVLIAEVETLINNKSSDSTTMEKVPT